MQHLRTPHYPAPRPTINNLLTALVVEIVEAEGMPNFDPLDEGLTLAAVWVDLCHLAGESVPALVEQPLGGARRPGVAEPAGVTVEVGRVNRLCERLLAELVAGDVPRPLNERFTLAFLWADLCRLAGEPLPPDVQARLDAPAVVVATPRRLAS